MKKNLILVFILLLSREAMAQNWLLAGNSGTNPSSNFLGSIDNKSVVFRTNNVEALRITGAGNIGIGITTPAAKMQVVGISRLGSAANYVKIDTFGVLSFTGRGVYQVAVNKYVFQVSSNTNEGLFFNNTNSRYEFRDASANPLFYVTLTGDATLTKGIQLGNSTRTLAGNIRWNGSDFQGYNGSAWISLTSGGIVGANTSLSNLVAPTSINVDLLPSGSRSLGSSASSWNNLFLNGKLFFNGTAFLQGNSLNTFVGNATGSGGVDNVYVGSSSGAASSSGFDNTFIGFQTGFGTLAANENTFIGSETGHDNTTGADNTFLGAQDGAGSKTGSSNIILGFNSTVKNGTNNCTIIGNNITATASNDLILGNNQNVGIGTSTPNFALDVCGSIRSKEVRVASGWCDYVFDKKFQLPPVYLVEQYIQQNNHLPEIPSAQEIQSDGLKLGEISTAMMKKIEELTLYVIDLQHQVDDLKKQIASSKTGN